LPRNELMDRAKIARIQAAEQKTNRQLINSIQLSQIKVKLGIPYLSPEHLYIGSPGEESFVEFENPTKETMQLRLELSDRHGVFSIPDDQRKIAIGGKGNVRIPVSFHVEPAGVIMTRSAKYMAAITVWDTKANLMVDSISITGQGPGYIAREHLNCLKPVNTLVDPPQVAIYAYDAEQDLPLPVPVDSSVDRGHRVEIRVSLYGARWYKILKYEIESDILGPDQLGILRGSQIFSVDGLDPGDQVDYSFETRIHRTTTYIAVAGETDDPSVVGASASVAIHTKIPVGYYDAWTSAPVREEDLERIRNWLNHIEEKLNDGCIRDCGRLSYHFSGRIFEGYLKPQESFEDEYDENNDLTHDILSKMRQVPIAIGRESLVQMGEPRSDLCLCQTTDCSNCIWGSVGEDRSYVAICATAPGPEDSIRDNAPCVFEGGADDYALMHELFHYGTKLVYGNIAIEEEVSEVVTECYWN